MKLLKLFESSETFKSIEAICINWKHLNQLEISLFFSLPFVWFLARDKTFVWKSNCKSIKQMNPVTKSAKYKLRCFLEKYFIFSRRYDQILWRTWDDWQYQILKHLILELNCSFRSSAATFFSSVIWYQMNLSLSSFEWISKIIEKSFSNSPALKHLCRFWLINETENFISATKIKGL